MTRPPEKSALLSHERARRSGPTMTDVALRAGVSQSTVSLVLNGSPGARLADATRKRVREAARELGYTLNRRAPRRGNEVDPAVIFMVDELASDPWMALAFDGAQKKAAEFGYTMCLAVTNDDSEAEAAIVDRFRQQNLVGVIYGTVLTRRVEPANAVMRHHTVLLNCYDAGRKLNSIIPGDLLGGRTATQHLIEQGHRRIGFINGQQGLDASRDRLKGYRQALSSNDIPFDTHLVKQGNWEPSSGYLLTQELLKLDPRPDAIFCANDLMALGCYDALHEAGLRIPEDMAVIGFDDREVAKSMHPPLTTLVLPHFEMGEIAAEWVVDMNGGHNTKPAQLKVDCTLVPRLSA